jgi:CBS domain-containing protein
MKVKDILIRDPECISPTASLTEAASRMRAQAVGILLVREEACLVGTVTDRDIIVRAVAEGLDPKRARVRQVMTQGVACCEENQSVEEAAQLMRERTLCRLAVVDEEKRPVGILSLADLAARAYSRDVAGQVIEYVSAQIQAAH